MNISKAPRRNLPDLKQLRVLFAMPTRWTETLGTPKVSIEIARELAVRGHSCSSFTADDVRIRRAGPLRHFNVAQYQWALLNHIRKHGNNYDVIQAEHNVIPFPRRYYKFDGLLISKSNGLYHFYEQFKKSHTSRSRNAGPLKRTGGNLLHRARTMSAQGQTGVERGFLSADIIHALNSDEYRLIAQLGHETKCCVIPNGLSEKAAAFLRRAAKVDDNTKVTRDIVFIGGWSYRKGSQQLPDIVRAIRSQDSDICVRLLGTGVPADRILPLFHPEDRMSLLIVQKYLPAELPELLRGCRVGLFPSFIEGFGLGVLEMLAAGIPVVSWDVPGPRDILHEQNAAGRLVEPGNVQETVAAIRDFLEQDGTLSARAALRASEHYRWPGVADQWLESVYAAAHRTSQAS